MLSRCAARMHKLASETKLFGTRLEGIQYFHKSLLWERSASCRTYLTIVPVKAVLCETHCYVNDTTNHTEAWEGWGDNGEAVNSKVWAARGIFQCCAAWSSAGFSQRKRKCLERNIDGAFVCRRHASAYCSRLNVVINLQKTLFK